jgi:uncharacterized protein (TIGR03437 family)
MRNILGTALLALVSTPLFAQGPNITAVLDAGGYSANVAPGMVFVVKGSNLCGQSTIATTPYTTAAMGGASIRFTPTAGGTPVDAYMIYCFNVNGTTQLAAELPSGATAGTYNVTVTNNGTASAPVQATVVARKFQLMTQPSNGSGRALLQNAVSSTQYDLNGFTSGPVTGAAFSRSPGKPSEFLIAWGTGLGAATGFDATAPSGGYDFIAQQNLDVKAVVGGMEITPIYAGRSNLYPGLDNITFQLPANITTGCYVNFQVKVAGQLSNLTTIAIAPNAQATACVDAQYSPAVLSKLDAGGTLTAGYFNLTSYNTNYNFSGQSLAVRLEGASGAFAKYTADTISEIPNLGSAGNGVCQVYQTTTTTNGSGGTGASSNLTFLDAGGITLNGSNVTNKAFTKANNIYNLSLGMSLTGPGMPPPGFNPSPLITAGTYTLTGAGGADVGPFTGSVTIGQPLTVTGGLPSTVNRSQDLNLAWTGGAASDVVVIAGTSAVLVSGTPANGTYNSGTFICTTTGDKQSFTVPTAILQQLPATPAGGAAGSSIATLSVFSTGAPTNGNGLFSAPLTAGGSTDLALFTAGVGNSATPAYQ